MLIPEDFLTKVRENLFTKDKMVMSNITIEQEEMIRLIQALKTNTYVKTLYFSESDIRTEAAILLSKLENLECIFLDMTSTL
jgi:hypothetical protein